VQEKQNRDRQIGAQDLLTDRLQTGSADLVNQRKIFARFEVEVEKIASQFRQNNDGGGSRSKTTETQPRRSQDAAKTHKQLAALHSDKDTN